MLKTVQTGTGGGGGGTVTNVATGTGLTGGPITTTGTISLANTAVTAGSYGNAATVATFTVDAQGRLTAAANAAIAIAVGAVSGAVANTVNVLAGTGLTGGGALTGNVTLTLANTAVTAGTYGNASTVATFTVDAQGRLTSASNATIAIANTAVSGLGTMSTQNANNVTITGGTIADSKGNVRDIPLNSQTAAYVLVAGDAGKVISITTGGVTVNASVFSAGNVVSIFNNSAADQTITQGTSVTMYLGGTATTGNRTLAQRGICTILCTAANTFVITGSGVT